MARGSAAVRWKVETNYLFTAIGLLATGLTTLAPWTGFAVTLAAVLVAVLGIRLDGFRIKATWGRPMISTYWIMAGAAMMIVGALTIIWGTHLSKRDPFDWRLALPGHSDVKGALYIHSIRVEGVHHFGPAPRFQSGCNPVQCHGTNYSAYADDPKRGSDHPRRR